MYCFQSSWYPSYCHFQDIFDVDHFITSLKHKVWILKELICRLKLKAKSCLLLYWTGLKYFSNQSLSLCESRQSIYNEGTEDGVEPQEPKLDLWKPLNHVVDAKLDAAPNVPAMYELHFAVPMSKAILHKCST